METDELKDIFLSYNKADKKWVLDLAAQIESETIDGTPASRKLSVFLDEWDMDSGDNLINKMNEGLKVSRFFAVVMSPEFFGSGWTNFEWTHVVSLDPTNTKQRIIPIFLRETTLDGKQRIDRPAPFNVLKFLDFRDEKTFTIHFMKLIRRLRGLPPERGDSRPPLAAITSATTEEFEADRAEPDQVPELLLSNLLPVKDAPKQIWSGKTVLTEPADVRRAVPEADSFILRGNRLYTFAQLSDSLCPLRKVIESDGDIKSETIGDWLADRDKGNWFVSLLNQLLAEYLASLRIQREAKGRFFFLPTEDGQTRSEAVGGDAIRMVAARKPAANGTSFWVHHAARMKFMRLGQKIFLQLEPTYLFTSDGHHLLAGKSMGRMRGKFWTRTQLPEMESVEWLDWTYLRRHGKQHLVTGYEIPVIEVDGEMGDIVSVFVRINSTGKALTQQEKRHARYCDSQFLKEASWLANRFENYFIENGIFSSGQLSRMKHVEFICELMLSLVQGDVLNKKTALDRVMATSSFDGRQLNKASRMVTTTLNRIHRMFPHLKSTRLRQVTDFYTLAVLIGKFETEGMILTDRRRNRLAWDLLQAFVTRVDEVRELQRKAKGAKPDQELYRDYLLTVSQMTDDVSQRRKRELILRGILESLFTKRDGQRGFTAEQRRIIWNTSTNRTCSHLGCNRKLSWDDFTIDHINPHSKGGRSQLDNAALMCREHNSAKGNRRR